jgi:DNA (cytosine-5)-methyltransferase 1
MNYIDLFSGVGGFALGAYWAGMKFDNHYFSEIEPYAVALYQQRFPDAIPLGDITKHKEWQLEPGEYIITGGFPCTDISVAGKGEGIHAARSGLWFAMRDVIEQVRPRFAIMENVGALTFRGLTDVLGSLAEIGYDAEWQDIRAEDVGAPHRRERIWIIAYPSGMGQRRPQRTGYGIPDKIGELSEPIRRTQQQYGSGGDGESVDELADSDSQRPQEWAGQTAEDLQRTNSVDRTRAPDWATEPDVGRLAHGVSHRVDRLRGLGNAIVPQIAEMLFRQIKAQLCQ